MRLQPKAIGGITALGERVFEMKLAGQCWEVFISAEVNGVPRDLRARVGTGTDSFYMLASRDEARAMRDSVRHHLAEGQPIMLEVEVGGTPYQINPSDFAVLGRHSVKNDALIFQISKGDSTMARTRKTKENVIPATLGSPGDALATSSAPDGYAQANAELDRLYGEIRNGKTSSVQVLRAFASVLQMKMTLLRFQQTMERIR